MKNKKDTTLKQKLAAYSAMAAGVLATSQQANAQIVYTDINPDTTVNNDSMSLDLNNDGTVDFWFQHLSSGALKGVVIKPQSSNAFINESDVVLTPYGNYTFPSPEALNAGDSINANKNWQQIIPSSTTSSSSGMNSFPMAFNYFGFTGGNWYNQGEHYAGLKFKAGTATYYGWARIIVESGSVSFTIKDYAYYADSNHAILAGQIFPDGIDNPQENNEVLCQLFAENGILHFQFNNPVMADAAIQIFNASGQVVLSAPNGIPGMQFPLNNLSCGMYLVSITKDSKKQIQKILINR